MVGSREYCKKLNLNFTELIENTAILHEETMGNDRHFTITSHSLSFGLIVTSYVHVDSSLETFYVKITFSAISVSV